MFPFVENFFCFPRSSPTSTHAKTRSIRTSGVTFVPPTAPIFADVLFCHRFYSWPQLHGVLQRSVAWAWNGKQSVFLCRRSGLQASRTVTFIFHTIIQFCSTILRRPVISSSSFSEDFRRDYYDAFLLSEKIECGEPHLSQVRYFVCSINTYLSYAANNITNCDLTHWLCIFWFRI